jgi:hypothetical protein
MKRGKKSCTNKKKWADTLPDPQFCIRCKKSADGYILKDSILDSYTTEGSQPPAKLGICKQCKQSSGTRIYWYK